MRRLLVICAALVIALTPGIALGQGGSKPKTTKSDTKKTLTATGTVSAMASDSLTVKTASGEMTFAVDAQTRIIGRGMGTKASTLKKEDKPAVLTEFLKNGDRVTVTYHDMGTTKHAASVRITRVKASK